MILSKHNLAPSACSLVQGIGFVVAALVCKKVGKTVYAPQRRWMLMPEHFLHPRQRLSVHCLRFFVSALLVLVFFVPLNLAQTSLFKIAIVRKNQLKLIIGINPYPHTFAKRVY
jgi:hypothetical protein